MKFVDQVRISLYSGKGGPGKVSFRKEPFAPRGGPNGGDGGSGGSVIVRGTRSVSSLFPYQSKRKLRAQDGDPGGVNNRTGKDGESLFLDVPVGSVVKNLNGELLLDVVQEEEFVLLKGGMGGRGNTRFKTSVNQAPTHAQPGQEGQEVDVVIELKSLADVGIIGFPNAGKSTLISTITAAKPQIADYPFTTINPQLGVLRYGLDKQMVLADIPGLIKGAHQGQGLGHQFLKHIERTKVFIHLLDVSDFADRDVYQDYVDINSELKLYDEAHVTSGEFKPLSSRPQLVVFSKVDAATERRLEEIEAQFQQGGVTVDAKISSASHAGVDDFKKSLARWLEKWTELQKSEETSL